MGSLAPLRLQRIYLHVNGSYIKTWMIFETLQASFNLLLSENVPCVRFREKVFAGPDSWRRRESGRGVTSRSMSVVCSCVGGGPQVAYR